MVRGALPESRDAQGRLPYHSWFAGFVPRDPVHGSFDNGETFADLPEPFRDDNENGVYDAGEDFFDFNNNQSRDAIDGIFNGYARQPRGCVAQTIRGYSDATFQYTTDLEKAKALLAEAGVAEGLLDGLEAFEVEVLFVVSGSGSVAVMVAVLLTVPGVVAVATSVRVAPVLRVNVPRLPVMMPAMFVALPWLGVTETKVRPAGNALLKMMPVAAVGPVLVTAKV